MMIMSQAVERLREIVDKRQSEFDITINSELMSSGSVRVASSGFINTLQTPIRIMAKGMIPRPTLVNEYLSLVQKEKSSETWNEYELVSSIHKIPSFRSYNITSVLNRYWKLGVFYVSFITMIIMLLSSI